MLPACLLVTFPRLRAQNMNQCSKKTSNLARSETKKSSPKTPKREGPKAKAPPPLVPPIAAGGCWQPRITQDGALLRTKVLSG